MKKLIFLLSLFGVAQAQIVGGFLPLNSTKSFTANKGTFTNLSVSGTSTMSSTLKLGSSAVLTGGNTGTVAVLSDAVFALQYNSTTFNPADASSYFLTNIPVAWQTSEITKVYVPYNCTLIGYSFSGYCTVVSSAETFTLAVNVDGATTNLNTALNFSVASGINTYTASNLSQSISAGSYITPKIITPTWATNPTGVFSSCTFWFVRRQ